MSSDQDRSLGYEWTWLKTERLHRAAARGDSAEIGNLLQDGCEIDAFDEDLGRTPLHYAAIAGHADALRTLIAAGANVNAHEQRLIGNTPLGEVAGTCSYEIAKLLVDAGADPTIDGWMQLTALDRSEERKDPEGRRVHDLLSGAAKWLHPDWLGPRNLVRKS